MNQPKKKLPAKPFFTRFLDQQDLTKVTGGDAGSTDKYPSDKDEGTDFPQAD